MDVKFMISMVKYLSTNFIFISISFQFHNETKRNINWIVENTNLHKVLDKIIDSYTGNTTLEKINS